ncbi:hypothetical protein HMPREF9999_02278 [Alloprevotella sp. oral taxon 473 str. F0040]|nr:hypothetical protein HMPREF9999_02278 [Alloprevotella sp. oral taxon 473 str. F0040]
MDALSSALDVTALYDAQKCSPAFAQYADSIVATAKTNLKESLLGFLSKY